MTPNHQQAAEGVSQGTMTSKEFNAVADDILYLLSRLDGKEQR